MKAESVDNMSMETIMNMETADMYVKSPMLEIGDKWVKETYENPEEITTIMSMRDAAVDPEETLQTLVDTVFDYAEITPSTYDEVKMLTTFACMFVSDEYISVSGRTTKTYKYEITAADVEKIFAEMGVELGLDQILSNTKLTVTSKYANGVGTEATFKFTTKIKMDYETVEIGVDTKAIANKINENISIKIPAEKDVVTMDEIMSEVQ